MVAARTIQGTAKNETIATPDKGNKGPKQAIQRTSMLTIPSASVQDGHLMPMTASTELLGGKSAKMADANEIRAALKALYQRVEVATNTLGFQKLQALIAIFESNDQTAIIAALDTKSFKDVPNKGQDADYVRLAQCRQVFNAWRTFGTARLEDGMQNKSFNNILKHAASMQKDYKAITARTVQVVRAIEDVKAAKKMPLAQEHTPELLAEAEALANERLAAEAAQRDIDNAAKRTPQARAEQIAKSMLRVAKEQSMSDDELYQIVGRLKSALKHEIKVRDEAIAAEEAKQAKAA